MKVTVNMVWVMEYDLPTDLIKDGKLPEETENYILEDFDMKDPPSNITITAE